MPVKRRSCLAFVICAAILFGVLFSFLFIGSETQHNCCGEDCPVCISLEQAEQLLAQIGSAAAALLFPAFFLAVACIFSAAVLFLSTVTPVSRKVRLNN